MYQVSGGGGSDAISRDMNTLLFSSTFKHPSEGEFAKIKQLIASDPNPNYSNNHHHQLAPFNHHELPHQPHQPSPPPPPHQQQQQNSLLRYRSAPSSFFANLIDGTTPGGDEDDDSGCDDFINSLSSSVTEPVSSDRFFGEETRASRDQLSRFPTTNMKQEEEKESFPPRQQDHAMYANSARAPVDVPHANGSGLNMEGSFRAGNSSSGSNLIRQSSSPAGFFANLNVENGIAAMRDVGAPSSSSRLNNQINFSSGPSSRFMPQIAENGHKVVGTGSPDTGHLVNGNDTNRGYDISTHNDSWNDSTFNSLKRSRNGDVTMYSNLNGFDSPNGDSKNYSSTLVHHMSLPKTSSEMAAVEKFLQFQQDSVPCKIRAKRGYATHPRSIAERVRRTRISERMRKLQELFPNMDKQTNTADMLDLAVEYIKDLQKEVQTLNEARSRCTCPSTKKRSIPTE